MRQNCIFITCICICCHPGRSVLDGCLALPFYLSNIPPCSILLHAPSWCHFYFHMCCTVCLRMLTAEPYAIFSSCISAKLLPRSLPALCAPFYVYLLTRRFLSRCKYYCFRENVFVSPYITTPYGTTAIIVKSRDIQAALTRHVKCSSTKSQTEQQGAI